MPLHWVTVTFTRVFDVAPNIVNNGNKGTYFSFEAVTGRQYSVYVPGRPRLETGDTVSALLSEPDNWRNLHGWVNHENLEVLGPDAAPAYMFIILSVLPLAIGGQWLLSAGSTGDTVAALAFLLGAGYSIYTGVSMLIIRKALLAKAAEIAANPPCTPPTD